MAHPTSGFYVKDELEYVSVSTVIGQTAELFDPGKLRGLEFWRKREEGWEEILIRSQRRGKIIHAEVEAMLLGTTTRGHEDEASYDEIIKYNINEYIMHMAGLLELIKEQNSVNDEVQDFLKLEEVLYCPHGYAGTADARFFWDGKYTIWDWKTVRSYKEYEDQSKAKKKKPRSKYSDAFIQIGAYGLAHNILVKQGLQQHKIKQGSICVCYDWMEPQLHVLDSDMMKQAALDYVARYEAYCDLMQTQFPRKLVKASAKEQMVDQVF